MALDFLTTTDVAFEKSGITNITLPAPVSASEGWAVGCWFRLKSSLVDATDRNTVNQLFQLSTSANGAFNVANTVSAWWASASNTGSIDGVEAAASRLYATAHGWVTGDNSNAGNWSDVTLASNDSDRLLILQLVNVSGSWKLRMYITVKGASATLVNESPAVTPAAIPVAHIRLGDRIPSPANRDWPDIAGQFFLLKRPLSIAEITQLAGGSSTITSVAAAADVLGYWPAEAAGATLLDASGNGNPLTQIGGTASYAGFDFVSSGPATLAPVAAAHGHAAQSSALSATGAIAPAYTNHAHLAQTAALGLVATSVSRPTPHGDVDLALSNVSNATSAIPTVTLAGDPEANQNIPNSWHNLCARIDGVLGKTPQFSISNVHLWRNGAAAGLGLPQRGWRPWWRIAGGASTSWQRFDGYTVSGNTINFANAAAFATATIEVAFFPVWNLTETNALFDAVYASGVGSEPPKAIAYRSTRPALPLGTHNETAAITSPDGIAVPVLPMRSVRITSAAATSPDGLPKRKAILLFNMHAQEASGGWVADRFIRLLISSGTDAIWLRDRFVFDCYSVNNSGLYGAASRGVVEGWDGFNDLLDPNRAWPLQLSPPNGPIPEVNDVAAAIATDSNAKADVLISYHSDGLTSVNYGLAYYFSGWDALPAMKAFKDLLIAGVDGLTLSATADLMLETSPGLYRDQGFGRNVLGAALAWVQEVTFATSDYVTDSQSVATRQVTALRQLTQDGFLPAAINAAATLHGHQAQPGVFAVAGSLSPQRAVHAHSAQSPLLAVAILVAPAPTVHSQAASSIMIASAGQLAAQASRHAHISTIAAVIAAGQLAAQASRHTHSGAAALLSVTGSAPPKQRIAPVSKERRILKLRFS